MPTENAALRERIAQAVEELREEATGSRGRFYEDYGSAFHPLLAPLADLLEQASAAFPQEAAAVADALMGGSWT